MGKKVFYILNYLIVVLGWISCTTDEKGTGPDSLGMTTLQMGVTRSGEGDSKIESVRMIVFNSKGRLLVNTNQPEKDFTFDETIPSGLVNIYLIANELDSWNLNDITSIQELKNKYIDYKLVYPMVDDSRLIPMLGNYENENAIPNDTLKVLKTSEGEGTVKRLYAKTTLKLTCNFSDIKDKKIAIDYIQVKQMPEKSYLYPAVYNEPVFDGNKITPIGHYTQNDDTGFSAVFDFYIPEYLINNKENYTCLFIKAYEVNNPQNTREYMLPIGDGIAIRNIEEMKEDIKNDNVTLADLTITRNTYYRFDAKLVGFNQELEVDAKVMAWEGVEISGEYPTHLLTVSRDNFNLPVDGEGNVYISTTNPEGWSATIGNGSGKTQFVDYMSGDMVKTSGYLNFKVTGDIVVADTIRIQSGQLTKKIFITTN